jgi:hypothetical protein
MKEMEMSTRKIADPPAKPCTHPEHHPPSMMVFQPGTYEHECPKCHHIVVFTVQDITARKRDWARRCLEGSVSIESEQDRDAASWFWP